MIGTIFSLIGAIINMEPIQFSFFFNELSLIGYLFTGIGLIIIFTKRSMVKVNKKHKEGTYKNFNDFIEKVSKKEEID
ncbi:MAG: hypothetical protein ACTSRH_15865 [Promethearchaeota archaeon]